MKRIFINIDPTLEGAEEIITPDAMLVIEVPEGVEINLRRLTGEMMNRARDLLLTQDFAVLRGKLRSDNIAAFTGGSKQQWWNGKDFD